MSRTPCPQCTRGFRFGTQSGINPDTGDTCMTCMGSGSVDTADPGGQAIQYGGASPVFGDLFGILRLLFFLAVAIFTVLVPVSLWTEADGVLRPLLEIFPSGLVADSPDDQGAPIVIGGLVLAGVIAAVYFVSRWRRGLIRGYINGAISYPALLGASVARMLLIVGGLSLAMIAGQIAAAADLRAEPGSTESLTAVWQLGLALTGIGGLSYYGLKHRIKRERAREQAGPEADSNEGLGLLTRALRRAG